MKRMLSLALLLMSVGAMSQEITPEALDRAARRITEQIAQVSKEIRRHREANVWKETQYEALAARQRLERLEARREYLRESLATVRKAQNTFRN